MFSYYEESSVDPYSICESPGRRDHSLDDSFSTCLYFVVGSNFHPQHSCELDIRCEFSRIDVVVLLTAFLGLRALYSLSLFIVDGYRSTASVEGFDIYSR